ncbi:MAG: sigma-70 family RNA polymerase sigma factor [Pyrinomonadaceae bacterium]|nr:sigma-70 family RNA polymerase sigma factor [Pyrinomonadaceae bacterium]
MFFSKSITFDQEELNEVALAANANSVYSTIENEFIERLKAGEPQAFDELVTHYSANIYALLLRLTEDDEEARDLTQDTFLSALRAIKNFRGDADLKTWLYRIAVNESRNRFRWWKRRNRSSMISLDADAFNQNPLSETISDSAKNPEEETLKRERERALRQALSELPANFREVIVLRDIQGLSYEEVASALETNVGTVKSRIARGREELRKKLSGF